jgi:hypothetical protein
VLIRLRLKELEKYLAVEKQFEENLKKTQILEKQFSFRVYSLFMLYKHRNKDDYDDYVSEIHVCV